MNPNDAPKTSVQLPITNILVEDRARKSLGKLDELSDSIRQFGVLQPISVQELGDGRFRLIAGERRLRAALALGLTEIPAMVYKLGSLQNVELYEIELHENVHRLAFTWYEEKAAIDRVHSYYVSKDGVAVVGAGPTGHTMQKTADMIGKSKATVSESIKLSRLIEQVPELKNCKTESEARQFIRKLENIVVGEQRAVEYEKREKSAIQSDVLNSFKVGDFFDLISSVPNEYAALVEIDPPYGIALDEKRKASSLVLRNLTMSSYKEVADGLPYIEFLSEVLISCLPKMRQDSWLILWYDIKKHDLIVEIVKEVGLNVCEIPAFWIKNRGQTQAPRMYLGHTHEPFLYACKGRPFIHNRGRADTFLYNVPADTDRIHPTERPIQLIQDVLNTFIEPTLDGGVLVPFAGSGNTLLAAHNLKRQAVGFDLSPDYKNGFVHRLMSFTPPLYGTRSYARVKPGDEPPFGLCVGCQHAGFDANTGWWCGHPNRRLRTPLTTVEALDSCPHHPKEVKEV